MNLCEYGCGQEATHFKQPSKKVPNGRWMCRKTHHSCPAVRERREKTSYERFGAANIFSAIHHLPEFADTSKAMRKRASDQMKDPSRGLGFRNRETLDKANAAFQEKYGVDNAMYLESAKQNLIQTNMDRYGVPCKVATYNHYQKSKIADRWLDELGVPNRYREQWIKADGKRYKADAYDPTTNTVYEFYGNYWHGNPRMFEPNVVNKQAHRTMGQLYKRSKDREKAILAEGFKLIHIWEDEYKHGGA